MLNKPKYTLLKNTRYALNGLIEVIRNESSFQLQLLLFTVMNIVAWSLPIAIIYSAVLSVALFVPLLAELANSAVERVVDLVTMEYHELAKRAKDAGAALVFISLVMMVTIWVYTLFIAFTN
ncbi:MAG TPA: diacylglycerol kinase [Sulfuricurvum sp.]|nr:diacylglycerol kinase [Sulfuricurvum sp.]